MNTTVPAPIIDRMRANLAAAGISLSDADLAAIEGGPFLQVVVAFEERSVGSSDGAIPDYVAGMPSPPSPVTTNRDEPASEIRPGSKPGGDAADTILSTAIRLRAGEISPVELVERALRRIDERDAEINAFQHVQTEEALAAARRVEREIAAGEYRGPLHGVPIAIKDLIAQRGVANSAGSRILAGEVAPYDAAAVERLEAAGAIIVGRTRMSEFAYLPGSSNAHYGATRNPVDPTRDAGGSSSGSAAAVATGMALAAIGSDTGGSIRIPAAFCGVVGLKPTFGRISLHGVVPLAWSLDHLGPLTRSVADAALLLGVLDGEDPRDARTRAHTGFGGRLEPDPSPLGLRVAVPVDRDRERLGVPEAWAAVDRALGGLERAGADVVTVELPEMEDLWILNNTILGVEAASFHAPWLRSRLLEYGDIPRQRLLAAFAHGPDTLVRAQRQRREIRERLEHRLERIDVLALPTQPDGAPPFDSPGWTLNTAPFNVLGWPALSMPIGTTEAGLPLALQLVGKPWTDASILRAGQAVESALE